MMCLSGGNVGLLCESVRVFPEGRSTVPAFSIIVPPRPTSSMRLNCPAPFLVSDPMLLPPERNSAAVALLMVRAPGT